MGSSIEPVGNCQEVVGNCQQPPADPGVMEVLEAVADAYRLLQRARHHVSLHPDQPEKRNWRPFVAEAIARLQSLLR